MFLALAIGLIVGTAALNGPLSDELKHQVDQLIRHRTQQYRSRSNSLKTEVNQKEQFATQIAPVVLAGQARRAPGADRVDAAVGRATSKSRAVGSEARRCEGHRSRSRSRTASSSRTTTARCSTWPRPRSTRTRITGLPANSDGVETSTALLAAVLMDHVPAVPRQSQQRSVLRAYERAELHRRRRRRPTGPAEAVVVLATLPYTDQDATDGEPEHGHDGRPVRQGRPDRASARPATPAPGNVIGAVTGDASLSKTVSTVDNDQHAAGRIAVTLALNEQVVSARPGTTAWRRVPAPAAEAAVIVSRRRIRGRGSPSSGRRARRTAALPAGPPGVQRR